MFTDQIDLHYIYIDIRTFEVLLRTYEVREGSLQCGNIDDGGSLVSFPCKRRQCSSSSSNGTNKSSTLQLWLSHAVKQGVILGI